MARIRTVKPEFFRHFDLYKAEKETGLPLRLSYMGLWTAADREGRFRWRPEVLKLDVLPYDSDVDFSLVLEALLEGGWVLRYACPTRAPRVPHACPTRRDALTENLYGVIPSFKAHQIINNRESLSTLPPPPEVVEESATLTRAPRVPHACPTPQVHAQGEREREMNIREREYSLSCGTKKSAVGAADKNGSQQKAAPKNQFRDATKMMPDGEPQAPIFSGSETPIPEPKPERQKDPIWEALSAEIGARPSTPTERSLFAKAVRELRTAGATPEEIRRRCANYRKAWPHQELTVTALIKHWSRFNTGKMENKSRAFTEAELAAIDIDLEEK